MTSEEYQRAMRELARGATLSDTAAARMEAVLEQTFESPVVGSRDHAPERISFAALAAAALVVAACATAWYAWRQTVTLNNVTVKADRKVGAAETAEKADRRVGTTDSTEKTGLKAGTTTAGRHSARRLPPVIRPEGFVAVPTAAGLPQFESGAIVRMSLPVAVLPAYGVDISPASGDDPIEADVLVGQDGRARAIRLVANNTRSDK